MMFNGEMAGIIPLGQVSATQQGFSILWRFDPSDRSFDTTAGCLSNT